MVEQLTLNQRVAGSSPARITILVKHLQENACEAEKASVVAMVVGVRRFLHIGQTHRAANYWPLCRIHLGR